MGQFNDYLFAEFVPPKTRILTKELSYKTPSISNSIELWRLAGNIVSKGLWNDIDNDSIKHEFVNNLTITVPVGFKTDLASIPRGMWWFVAPTDLARAAVIHDFLYTILEIYLQNFKVSKKVKKKYRKMCDEVLYSAMMDSQPRLSSLKMSLVYYAVRLFGGSHINGRS